jgi:hypothetical protein
MADVYKRAERITDILEFYPQLTKVAKVIAKKVVRIYALDGDFGTILDYQFSHDCNRTVEPYEAVEAMEEFNSFFGYKFRYRLTSESPDDWKLRLVMTFAERELLYPQEDQQITQ